MALQIAQKQKTKLKVGLLGPSGSGKTYSALLMASGMAKWNKIAIIDSENGSANLYADLGGYSVLPMQPPYTPESYIDAISECVEAGMEVIIIDSITHEWDGGGGVLDIHGNMPGNSFANWRKVTPRHNAFIEKILQVPVHVIATMRAKQDYVLNDVNGKQVPQKVGLKAVTREGVDYEFTLVFDLDIKHNAEASKDRTRLFMDKPAHLISEDTGKSLVSWGSDGVDLIKEIKKIAKKKKVDMGKALSMLKVDSLEELNPPDLQKILKKLQDK